MITRILYSALALATFLVMIPDTGSASEATPDMQVQEMSDAQVLAEISTHDETTLSGEAHSVTTEADHSASNEHTVTGTEHAAGPHIPAPKGDIIHGWDIAGVHITNTIFSTWIFMVLLTVLIGVFSVAIRTDRFPRLKAFGLDITERILAYTTGLLGDRGIAKRYVWLLGGLMIIIFLGNLYGLMLDWLVLVSKDHALGHYLRPMYSDLSTTLVFSLTVIMIAQFTAFKLKGPIHHLSHYLWNYHGDSTAEKIVSVFIGWLHFAGEFIRIGSLSMRLFLNIFVGMILISVAVYVGSQIPSFGSGAFKILSLPFWFFELLVAFLQAYIFMTLSSLYIRESIPEKAHH